MRTRLDALSRKLLVRLAEDARRSVGDLAADVGAKPDVVEARLQMLQQSGVVTGFSVKVDAAKVGRPHELFVTGAPGVETTKEALEQLCQDPAVTRVFTMASQNSVAFTVRGDDVQATQALAERLVEAAGLSTAQYTLIVQTWVDDEAKVVV